jgi:uncharacterized protein YjbJ (UPF0337 family)
MNTLNLKGNWNEVAGKLKQKFANLTDDDLFFKEGKQEELLGRLQKKLGKSKEEIRKKSNDRDQARVLGDNVRKTDSQPRGREARRGPV